MRTSTRLISAVILAIVLVVTASAETSAVQGATPTEQPRWLWPVDGARQVVAPFRAPAHKYGAGHRGVDLAAASGAVVRAPAEGVVAFRGVVVDRPLMTIEHAGGLVSTFEPLLSTLSPGDVVDAGDEIGVVGTGGHAAPGSVHLGVRLDGEYINPMLLFGDVPRAVLLPCCGPI
ncbi:murein hydrolase activator EnvC family protein [Microbacterium sp. SA39]|uniref:murein hydrolase activator EnvC family protein n=1 Tax=Microbacterium sp. SA39 TaxID=1263625 RepID=UPI00061F7240|nr:M23 family metallopeptidase [Microbacterium sp. SA39]KJQ52946.1 Murein hydrolase activator NlpD precursor [Microbacterium sp. SA39]